MSRRTKFIILAVFLVLLGVTIAGVVHFWRARSPLRITLSSHQEPRPPKDPTAPAVPAPFAVIVENTAHVPVLFYGAILNDVPPGTIRLSSYPMALIQPLDSFGKWSTHADTSIPERSRHRDAHR